MGLGTPPAHDGMAKIICFQIWQREIRIDCSWYKNECGTGEMWDRGRFETTEKVVKIRFQENTRSEKGKYSDNYVVNCWK